LQLKSPFEKGGFRGNAVHLIVENSAEIISPVILREWSDEESHKYEMLRFTQHDKNFFCALSEPYWI